MSRFLDIVFSGLALVVLSPLLLPLVLILRVTGEGEIFFTQDRVGRGGRYFGLYKFATMLKDSPNMGSGTVTLKDDPRVLPIGKFLRATKINELPQLLNILLGDMSIVGPRPQTQRCFDAFPERSQSAILKVRPGLSGLGSIAFRGEEDMLDASSDSDRFYDTVIMPYKGRLEEWYVANASLTNYIKVIFATAVVVMIPTSQIFWRLFAQLPQPPAELIESLNWPHQAD